MSAEAEGPTLSQQFAALVGYDRVVDCSLARYSTHPCDGEVVWRAVTACCGRTMLSCAGHHERWLARQAEGTDIDPECGRRNDAAAWFPV
ncbi:hypothetical protein [Xylanimonas sp. McL0601]|uniref:hypothetical protein n=1 Tax=Xylanimonas sp. McL0601 TaxID=3414739 RepID=UPI003CF6F33C